MKIKLKTKYNVSKIRKAMEEQHYNESSLAQRIGISKQLLNYQLKHLTIKNIWPIAYVLKLDLWDLIK
jgi:transcriptional regulator with PAS, ATPase and Fis domain